MEQEIEKIIQQVKDLYPNIAVMSKLSNLLRDPNVDLVDLADLIKTEPALTVDMIKISNSSIYAAAAEVSTIDSALARIGFNDARKIVSYILTRDICSKDLTYYRMSADDFLSESMTVSILMEVMAPAGRLNRSEAATIGTLHNIGRVIINNLLAYMESDAQWDRKMPVSDWEKKVVLFHHGEAGAHFLSQMDFSLEFQDVIRYHVEPEGSPDSPAMRQLLHYCVRLKNALGAGLMDSDKEIPDPEWLNPHFDLSPTDIHIVLAEAQSRFEVMSQEIFNRGTMQRV
ncbi:MAG: HDOD domain-containing protein [Verrucomicrobiae bacterium]|nr:HDOD domain-containing protein [Verrucomicrobiae bacterium]